MSSGNSSSFSIPQNQEKKQIPRFEVRFTNKIHPFMWLVCKTRAKILLSDPETSLTTPRLLPLRRSRRSYGNYQSPQSSGSSRNILKRLGRSGRSGRSYGNQALPTMTKYNHNVVELAVSVADPGLQVREGARSPKKFFSVLRASFWWKHKGGQGPTGPSPGSATVSPISLPHIFPI